MGYPELAKQILDNNSETKSNILREWKKEAIAQLSEYKVFELLKDKFFAEPCLLIANFNERNLCRLAQDTLSYNREEDVLSDQVTIITVYIHQHSFNLGNIILVNCLSA